MSVRGLKRVEVLGQVKVREATLRQASELLAILACWPPALRAARTDLVAAPRTE